MSSSAVVSDMAAARRELSGQYGVNANAEELIRTHMASIPPEVRAVAKKPVNQEATKDLDLGDIKVPSGHVVIDAVVRGDEVSYVAETPDGRWYKGVQNPSARSSRESAADASIRHSVQSEQQLREATANANAEIALATAEAQRAAEAKHAEELAKLREELAQAQAKLGEKAEKEAEKEAADAGSSGSRKTSTARRKTGTAKRKTSGAGSRKTQAQKQAEQQQRDRKANEG